MLDIREKGVESDEGGLRLGCPQGQAETLQPGVREAVTDPG